MAIVTSTGVVVGAYRRDLEAMEAAAEAGEVVVYVPPEPPPPAPPPDVGTAVEQLEAVTGGSSTFDETGGSAPGALPAEPAAPAAADARTVLPDRPKSMSNADVEAFAAAWMAAGFAHDATQAMRRALDYPFTPKPRQVIDPNTVLHTRRGYLKQAVLYNNGYLSATFTVDGHAILGKADSGGNVFSNFFADIGAAAGDFAAMPGLSSALFVVTGGATLALDNRDEIAQQVIIDLAIGAAAGTAAGVAAGTVGATTAALLGSATELGTELAARAAEEIGLDVVPDPPPPTTSPGELEAIDQAAQDEAGRTADRTAAAWAGGAAGVLLLLAFVSWLVGRKG